MTGEPVPGDHYLWHWGDGPATEVVAITAALLVADVWAFDVGSTNDTERRRFIPLGEITDPNEAP